jgi:hypothetical protein
MFGTSLHSVAEFLYNFTLASFYFLLYEGFVRKTVVLFILTKQNYFENLVT